MINGKRIYWFAQLTGWTAYCSLVIFNVLTSDPEVVDVVFLLNILSILFFGIVTTHVQRGVFIRLGWLEFKLPRLIPGLLVVSFMCSLLISLFTNLVAYLTNLQGVQNKPLSISEFILDVFALLILVLFWNAIYFTFHFFQKSRKQEIYNLELAASNKESELKNLRSQLNPHFLFNSLNSIKALVDLDPAKSKIAITTLSNLLRQSLVLGKENVVTLAMELTMVKSYLDLEKIRFEERLTVDWQVDEKLKNMEILPFSVQMMVENAIKHGISSLKEGGVVRIIALDFEDRVEIRVENSGRLAKITDLGMGIQNIRQRLKLQYGSNANFSLKEINDFVIAKMIVKK